MREEVLFDNIRITPKNTTIQAMSSPSEQQAEGTWKQFKGQLQEAWGDLTGDDLDRYEGKREQLEGHIQEKTGENRKAVRKKIDRLSKDAKYSF